MVTGMRRKDYRATWKRNFCAGITRSFRVIFEWSAEYGRLIESVPVRKSQADVIHKKWPDVPPVGNPGLGISLFYKVEDHRGPRGCDFVQRRELPPCFPRSDRIHFSHLNTSQVTDRRKT